MIMNDSVSNSTAGFELSLVATLYESARMRDDTLVGSILGVVETEDFSDLMLQHVFEVTKSLVESGAAIDRTAIEAVAKPATVADEIDLDEVFQCPAVADKKQLDSVIKNVVRAASLRRMRVGLEDAAADVHDASSDQTIKLKNIAGDLMRMAEQLTQAEVRAAGTKAVPTLANDLDDLVAELQKTHGKEFLGLPTRTLPTFDKYTSGVRGFNLLAAQPGIGKTALGTQIGIDIANHNEDAVFVFFSFEMSRRDIQYRLVSMISGLRWKRIVFGTPGVAQSFSGDGLAFDADDRTSFQKAVTTLKSIGNRITICDVERLPKAGDAAMLSIVRQAKKQAGVNRAFVLIDSLQAMPFAKPQGTPWSNDIERDNHVIGKILSLQRSLDDPVLLISEQNKEGMGRSTLKSTRGTARAVYSPDCVLILQQVGESESDPTTSESSVDLKIVKGRDGTCRGTIPLAFEHAKCTFTERDEVVPADELGGARISN